MSRRPVKRLCFLEKNKLFEDLFRIEFKERGLGAEFDYFLNTVDMLEAMNRLKSDGEAFDLLITNTVPEIGDTNRYEAIEKAREINPNLDILIFATQSRYEGSTLDTFLKKNPNALHVVKGEAYSETFYKTLEENFDFVNEQGEFGLGTSINILLGPSGFGKSTITEDLVSRGFEVLTKYTTRMYRTKEEAEGAEVKSVDRLTFKNMSLGSGMIGVHEYAGNMYGFRVADLEAAILRESPHVTGLVDPDAAIEVKQQYLGNAKLIALLPQKDLLGMGLEKRTEIITELKDIPDGIVDAAMGRVDFDASLLDTQIRFGRIGMDYDKLLRAAPSLDYIASGDNLKQVANNIVGFVYGR